jgi:hypothetical protein
MPKLPANLAKAPIFDNPLRRTTAHPAQTEPANEAPNSEPKEATVIAMHAPAPAPEPAAPMRDNRDEDAALMISRITVRIDEAIHVALQTECYERRLRGEKTNVAEIAREVLGAWARRRRR